MTDVFLCGCKGTVHDPTCAAWKSPSNVQPPVGYTMTNDSTADWDYFQRELMRKLDRIMEAVETMARRSR